MNDTKWTVSNTEDSTYIGIIEFQDNTGEWHDFTVVHTKDESRLVFGGACNVGLIESGYIEYDRGFSFNENLQELVSDLECYYNDGARYTTRIVCNERM